MAKFTDRTGREWTFDLNVTAIKHVRSEVGVDLYRITDPAVFTSLTEPVALCGVVYALCQAQAEGAGISPEDFGRAMAGDVLDDALAALLEELVRFFPKRRRHLLEQVLQKVGEGEEMLLAAAEENLKVLDLKLLVEALAEPAQAPTSSGLSTVAPPPAE